MIAVLVLLLSTQLLWGRSSFWLPGWLLRRSIARKTLTKSIGKRSGRRADRLALIARDGLMALLALIFTVTTGGLIPYHVM
jgi:hypothetical protein